MLSNLFILFAFLILLVIVISKWKVHPFAALILLAILLGLSLGIPAVETVDVVLRGFSETLRWIAVIIILGALIGEVLQETGGALRISDRIVASMGKKRLPWAMGFTGYLVSIPVFVDVAYILLQPITESLAVKSKKPVLFVGLALTAGLTVAHTLVPPTPGPMAVASLLEVNLGEMLLLNLAVAAFAMTGGVLFVIYFVKNSWIDHDQELARIHHQEEQVATNDYHDRSLFSDVLPIVLPILLIGAGALLNLDAMPSPLGQLFEFISLPLVAVLIGSLVAILQLKQNEERNLTNQIVERAILKSALVIMITGAGGSLGYVIKQAGVQDSIIDVFAQFPFLGVMLPLLVAAVLTTATGSITVSLVSSASMIGPMVDVLPVSPTMTAALIGCGSFCVFHANSSFFWLLNRLHNVPPNVLYRTFTLQSLVMGLSGLMGLVILYLFGLT